MNRLHDKRLTAYLFINFLLTPQLSADAHCAESQGFIGFFGTCDSCGTRGKESQGIVQILARPIGKMNILELNISLKNLWAPLPVGDARIDCLALVSRCFNAGLFHPTENDEDQKLKGVAVCRKSGYAQTEVPHLRSVVMTREPLYTCIHWLAGYTDAMF